MNTSEQIEKVAAALAKAQAECKPLIADKLNPFFKSNYADLSSVIKATKEAFEKNNLSVIQGGGEPCQQGLIVTQLLLHTSGQWIETCMVVPLAKQDAQAAGSALTYGRRYLLAASANLAAEEDDDDGQSASAPDNSKRRDKAALTAITDKQIKQADEFFKAFKASKENIIATVKQYSGNRVDQIDAMMTTEATTMINALNKKHCKDFALSEPA